jgi:hypothetical protein
MNEQYKKKYLKYKNKYNKFKKKIKGGYTYPAIIGSVSLIALLAYFVIQQKKKEKIITIDENIGGEDIGVEDVGDEDVGDEDVDVRESVEKEPVEPPVEPPIEPPVKSEADLALALLLKK